MIDGLVADQQVWKDFYTQLLGLGTSPRACVFALVACDQVAKLKPKHIKSYFASMRDSNVNGNPIMPLLHYASANIIKLIDIEQIRTGIGGDAFIRYHTTYSSTGTICLMVCQSLGAMRPALVSDPTFTAGQDSAANYWDPALNAGRSSHHILYTDLSCFYLYFILFHFFFTKTCTYPLSFSCLRTDRRVFEEEKVKDYETH